MVKKRHRWLKRYRSIYYQTIWMTREGLLRGVDWLEVVNLSFIPPSASASLFEFVGCAEMTTLRLHKRLQFSCVHHSLLPHILTYRRSTNSLALPVNRVACVRCSTLKSCSSNHRNSFSLCVNFSLIALPIKWWVFHAVETSSKFSCSLYGWWIYFRSYFSFFIVLELPCITFSHVCTWIVKLIDNLSESESGSGYVEANPKALASVLSAVPVFILCVQSLNSAKLSLSDGFIFKFRVWL